MSTPRVLFFDIETTPILGYTWGIWQQDVIQIKEDWQILCIAWKWLGENKVHVVGQDDLRGYKPGVNDDKELMHVIHALLDEADIVMGHNSDQFDVKKCNARMIVHGMAPPSPYVQLDTKKIAKRYAAFTSNRLKDLAKDLDVSRKGSPGGFETWLGCMAGDEKAWSRMKRYNKLDIPPLEDIYIRLRPWMNNHPAMNILTDRPDACPKCGKGPMLKRGTRKVTKTTVYQRYQCKNCHGWSTDRHSQRTDVKFTN